MNPYEILEKRLIEMLENDFSELSKIVSEMKTEGIDKKKLGEAYFVVQRLQMELYKLISFKS
jgi:benzoyl-CoA reductase/2-hydroxyglutaryl-CoA dehydratase subunit BcrC/BadD/HgdB